MSEIGPSETEIDALRAEVVRLRALLDRTGPDSGDARPGAPAPRASSSPTRAPAAKRSGPGSGRGRVPSVGAKPARPETSFNDRSELSRLNDELRRSSEALASSEARFRTVIDSSTDYAIIVTDLAGTITTWNEGARRMTGWAEAEVLGRAGDFFFTPEDRESGAPESEMTTARQAGRAEDERWHLRKDGSRFWAVGLLMPLRGDGATIQGYLKILRDRTAEREAARWQLQRDERLRLALGATALVGVWDRDCATDLIYSDENFARIYNVDPEWAARGAPLEEYVKAFHPEDRPGFEAALARTMKDGAPFSQEYRIVQPDGSARWVLARGTVVRDELGQPVRFPGVTIDITERKQAEARQAALVELGDRFRDLTDTAEMAFVAAEILGRTLGLSRTGYGSVDPEGERIDVERDWTSGDVPSVAGQHRFADYGSFVHDLRAGRTVIIDDVESDPRTAADAERLRALAIRALLNVPV